MNNININSWKPYKMDDIFNFTKGKRLTKNDMIPGKLNYLGAISENNAVRDFIDASAQHSGNCITVNYNGSVGEAFYQSKPFWATDDINILDLKDYELNENIGLFLCTIIKKNKFKFSYGRKWTLDQMKNTVIYLPSINSKPDYDFMDTYINNLKIKHIKTKNLNIFEEINLNNWKKFIIKDIFNLEIGKSEDLYNLELGNINYVGRTSLNNGIQAFVDANKINMGKCITLGMVGTYFPAWQEESFSCSQNILILRNGYLNKYNALFINSLLKENIKNKYSYNRPIQKNKFALETILLPTKVDGSVDWDYMEKFIKKLPYSDKI